MSEPRQRRLGRGLDSLIRGEESQAEMGTYVASHEPEQISVDDICVNPHQPRKDFNEAQLAELTDSIRQEGVLQPLMITRAEGLSVEVDKPFVLIAGERRLRAASRAGLSSVPCIVRQADERKLIEWAMIENIQRADLNPIERAQGYRDYMTRFDLTQEQVASRMGQARTTVANYLRLIDLDDEVQQLIAEGQLSFGHAKVLAGLTGDAGRQLQLARRVVGEGLSVRKLEELASAREEKPSSDQPTTTQPQKKPAYVRDIEQQLTETIGTKVTILPGRAKNTGRIVVEYYSLDDFDRIAGSLGLNIND